MGNTGSADLLGKWYFPKISLDIVDENHSQKMFPFINHKSALQVLLDEHPNDNSIFSKCCVSHYEATMVFHHLYVVKAPKNGKLRSVQHEDVIGL